MTTITSKKTVQQIATRDNTVFLTIAAFSDHESKTAAFRKSAEDQGVSLAIYDKGEPWQGFYLHKIERVCEYLKQHHKEGKQFAFFLDSRDVVFIDPLDSILAKFNALYDGRVIFNHDMPGKVWPSHKDYLEQAIEEAMQSEHARINSGVYAGDIETIRKIQLAAIAMRRELKEGCPRPGMLEKLYKDIGTKHLDDDQHLYQICMTYSPELFRLDYDKELFAVLMSYPNDIRECSDDPKRHDVINRAAIIHSPWLSHDKEWNERVFQNRWKR